MRLLLKISLSIAYLSIWVGIYLAPRKMFYIGGNDGPDGWILFLLIFVGLPMLLYNTLKLYKIKQSVNQVISVGSLFLLIPFMLIINKEDQAELESNKEFTTGVIIQSYYVKPRRRPRVWSVKAEYYVKGIRYFTSTKEDENRLLVKGDTVTIVYSKITPQMSEIRDLIEHYK